MNAPYYGYKKADLRFDQGLFRDRGNQVMDVTNSTFGNGGAKGNNSVDDTLAFKDAIAAALQSRVGAPGGSVYESASVTVYVPLGVYKITDTLAIPSWMRFVGCSRQGVVLNFQMANIAKNCVSVTGDAVNYGYNGSIEEMQIISTTVLTSCQDVIALDRTILYRISRVHLQGAGRYGLSVDRTINLTCTEVFSTGNKSAGLWVGATTSISTTARFTSCYFTNTTEGPGATVAGIGIAFSSSIFESNGTVTREVGNGLVVRSGYVSVDSACYFEDNAANDILWGTEAAAGGVIAGFNTITGANTQAGYAGIALDQYCTRGLFLAGVYSTVRTYSLRIHPSVRHIFGSALVLDPLPSMTDASDIYTGVFGWLFASDVGTGEYRNFGRNDFFGRHGAITEYLEIAQGSAPDAPAAGKVRIYAADLGGGKTRLNAIFDSGGAQEVASEP